MKKLTPFLLILFVSVLSANAQILPIKIKTFLDSNYTTTADGTWRLVAGACDGNQAILSGDFDGDGQNDFLVRIRTGRTAASARLHLIAFFNSGGQFTPEPFYEEALSGDILRSASAVMKKGTNLNLGLGAEGEGPSIVLATDAVGQYICETDASRAFIYKDGAMKDVRQAFTSATATTATKVTSQTPIPAKTPIPNLNGRWTMITKGKTGAKPLPIEFYNQADAALIFRSAGTDFPIFINDDAVFLIETMGVIAQNANVIRLRGGNYIVRDGYTGPIGTGNEIPRLETDCRQMIQGKVAVDQKGSMDWSEGRLNRLCIGTTNPASTVACFQTELKNQTTEDSITACSPAERWFKKTKLTNKNMKPLQTVIPNLTGKWLIYGADGKVIRLSFATISLVRDEFTFAIKTSNSMKSASGFLQDGKLVTGWDTTGTISPDSKTITWSDKTVWKREAGN